MDNDICLLIFFPKQFFQQTPFNSNINITISLNNININITYVIHNGYIVA